MTLLLPPNHLEAYTGMKPLLYDLFCGAGGAAVGYRRAGFKVIGVDNRPQKNYPFEFIQMDALEFLQEIIDGKRPKSDAIHASPPCQSSSRVVLRNRRKSYPMLIEPTRHLLTQIAIPYVIENVVGAALRPDIRLCGQFFGLQTFRHRWFETNWDSVTPLHEKHNGKTSTGTLAAYHTLEKAPYITVAGHAFRVRDGKIAMKIDWMTGYELTQAIPPVYTKFIGNQLKEVLGFDTSSFS